MTTKKNNKKKSTAKMTKKKSKGKKGNHYELKLFSIALYTLFSIFALHTNIVGILGEFIRNIYLGLFSYVGFFIPYFILFIVVYSISNRLITRKTHGITGLIMLFIGINFIFIVMRADSINSYFESSGQLIKNSYLDGIQLIGGGLIDNILGYYSLKLFNKMGLIILAIPLFVVSFLFIIDVNLIKSIKRSLSYRKKVSQGKKEIEEEAEKLKEERKKEKYRLKEIKKQKSREIKEQRRRELELKEQKKDELEAKKLKEVLKKHNDKVNDNYNSLLDKSPSKVLVASLIKNIRSSEHKYTSIKLFDDEEDRKEKIVEENKDIFDNHLESEYSDVKITGFGEDVVNKVDPEEYIPLDENEVNNIIINDEDSLEETVNQMNDEFDLDHKIPLSEEEKKNVSKFDNMFKKNNSNIKNEHENKTNITHHNYDNYKMPSFNLLNDNNETVAINQSKLYEKAKKLETILQNFNVKAKVIGINKGPSITRYEVKLEPGVKLSKITNLSDDIALNLAAEQVRIAAVPNKPVVGIEIPNDSKSIVTLKEVIDNNEFKNNKAKLIAGLGKSIAGNNVLIDLADMPHLLIAGATGSGKSVCVNTLIVSILMNVKPDEVKFLMVDPKVVELNVYNGIPHLILPVVTDPKKANIALEWAVREMDRRYEEFSTNGVKEINGFNKKFKDDKEKYMPHIVVIIDELADLMMVAPSQVEDSICRLTQKARASGIHLIVATQRPSVDVITGVIKANIPSRIAFSVSSSVDSRTILDMTGAEKLLGKGDMLYSPAGSIKPRRVQGAFISEKEVEKVVNNIKYQCDTCVYNEEILETVASTSKFNESDEDEYLTDAIRLVVMTRQGSTSFLQRKFKIGYNRAARLMDTLEERGVVGPSQGSKPREVLMTMEEINNYNEN